MEQLLNKKFSKRDKMKKYLGILLIASIGGIVAIGLNKLFNNENQERFEQNYLARYASLNEAGNPSDFVQVADLVTPTVVHILTTVEQKSAQQNVPFDPFGLFNDPGFKFDVPNGPQVGSGSGVIISSDGYIVTNNHVINGASKIKVILNDKREFTADLIGKDLNTDLALLRIDEKNLPFALIGNSDDVRVGQWVLAVGNPFNLTSTVTAGIVSAKGRNLNLIRDPRNPETQYAIEAFIQTDAAVNPGNSGGALVSTEGKVIGINTAIASQNGQYAGYAFAIPSNLMKKVVDDLLKFGEVQRGFLGVQIQDVTSELADKENLKDVKGVFVFKVNPNSSADDAGIKDKDVIISIEDQKVNSSSELQEKIGKKNPGDKVKVLVLRDGKEKEFTVILKNKDGKTNLGVKEKVESNKALDCEFESISRDERLKLKITNGVRIKTIGEKSLLKKAGVPNGFVIININKNPVANPSEVKNQLDNQKGGILLEGINPDGSKGYYGFGIEK